jgi:hypothetical protein
MLKVLLVLWPSFVVAGIAEGVFFTVIDPAGTLSLRRAGAFLQAGDLLDRFSGVLDRLCRVESDDLVSDARAERAQSAAGPPGLGRDSSGRTRRFLPCAGCIGRRRRCQIDQPAKQVRVGLIGIGDKARVTVFAECCPDLHPVLACQVTAGQWKQGVFLRAPCAAECHRQSDPRRRKMRPDPSLRWLRRQQASRAGPRQIGFPDACCCRSSAINASAVRVRSMSRANR